MIKAAIEKIQQLVIGNAETREVDGRKYALSSMSPIKPPVQEEIKIATLTGIADYFRQNPDNIDLRNAVVHIASHKRVEVVSTVEGPWIQRHSYLTAEIDHKPFRYGQFMPLDEFMIALQTYFVQDETTAALLKMVGNITDESSVKAVDDGISQQVTVKAGPRIENAILPNPILLAPYRTFTQVEQPPAAFRVQGKQVQRKVRDNRSTVRSRRRQLAEHSHLQHKRVVGNRTPGRDDHPAVTGSQISGGNNE